MALGEGQCQDRDGGDGGNPSRHHLLVFWNCQGQGMSPGQRPPYHFPSLPLPPAKGPPCPGRGAAPRSGVTLQRARHRSGEPRRLVLPPRLPAWERCSRGAGQQRGRSKPTWPQCASCPCHAVPARASEQGLSPGESAPSRACVCATLPPCPGSSLGDQHTAKGGTRSTDSLRPSQGSLSRRGGGAGCHSSHQKWHPLPPHAAFVVSHRISWGCDFWFLWQLGKTCNCGFLESKMRAEV